MKKQYSLFLVMLLGLLGFSATARPVEITVEGNGTVLWGFWEDVTHELQPGLNSFDWDGTYYFIAQDGTTIESFINNTYDTPSNVDEDRYNPGYYAFYVNGNRDTLMKYTIVAKSDGPAKQNITIVPAITGISLQMEDGKTVTGNLPAINAYFNYGTVDQEKLTDDLKYTYTAVEAEGSDTATDVISVDENGVVTALKAGDVYVKVALVSDEYAAAPTYVNVVVKAVPVVSTYEGTKFTAGANSAFYLTVAGSTTHLLDLENGASTTYKLSAGNTYYVYAAENREITNFTVDGVKGQMFDEFGYFSVKAGSEPKEVVVNTTEPVVADNRTKFTVTGGGTVEIWYQDLSYKFVYLTTLEPDANGVAYVELPDKINEFDIVAGSKSRLTEVSYENTTITNFYNGEYDGMPGNYYFFTDTKKEYHVTCVPDDVTKITFNISTADRAILKDSEGTALANLGYYATETKKLANGNTFYIYNQEGYELKSVKASNGEELTIEQIAEGEQRASFTVGAEEVTYTIECPALPKEPAKFIFPNGRNVSILTYASPRMVVVNFEEEEDVNTFDFDGAGASYYYIVANEGYKLVSVECNPAAPASQTRINSSNVSTADGKIYNSWCWMYKTWDPRTVTITVEKVVNVDFEATQGSKAVVMHENGSDWVTDYSFDAKNAAKNASLSLAANTNYYIFAVNGYALKEVLGDNGEAMTISDCEEHMPYSSNYVMFNSDEAPAKITIDSPEKKVEVDPSTVKENQVAGFDFTDPRFIFVVESGEPIKTGTYLTAETVLTDLAGTVQIELLDRQMQFAAGYTNGGVEYPSYLSVPPMTSTMWFTNPAGRLKFKFNDNVSTFTKIEFTLGQGYFTADNGTILGTVWEPAAPASAPSVYTVNAANGTNEVTFTAAQQVDLQKVKVTFTGPEVPTSIETVEASANEVAPVFYNLQGVRVENPAAGIYVRVQGNKVDKVLVK